MAGVDDGAIILERLAERWTLYAERWDAHRREHELIAAAVEVAVEADRAALTAALVDHHREHSVHEQAHAREHEMNELALAKAADAVEKRFTAINAVRESLRDQADRLATQEALDALRIESDRRFAEATKRTDERFESNRQRIEVLEKGDVKQEGRGLGSSATIAWIVTGLTVAGAVLGLVLTAANLLGP